MQEILTPKEMGTADRLTIDRGTPGFQLMEQAGYAVAQVAKAMVSPESQILIIAGTGNNGGDGFIAARKLTDFGFRVSIILIGDKARIRGDAKLALETIPDLVIKTSFEDVGDGGLIVDALFGAGLDRDIEGKPADTVQAINASDVPVLAVDLPSGIDGTTGQVRGVAVKATATVTFFRLKPGHLLLPGRMHCGETSLAQIGIEADVLKDVSVIARQNSPGWWQSDFPLPDLNSYKHQRGHVLCLSGPLEMAGATRLASQAALRSGAGLVTIAASGSALFAHACHTTSLMLHKLNDEEDIDAVIEERRIASLVLGPGMPPSENTRGRVLSSLSADKPTVLDAGALSAFEGCSDQLFQAIGRKKSPTVLTPHDGEFQKLFPDIASLSSKIERAREAARRSDAIVVLKGADTVIATPNGKVSISGNAPPFLATAGSGDVLSGLIPGPTILAASLCIQTPAFQAVNAAVWMHSEAANMVGPGLVSSDLDDGLKQVITQLFR